MVNRDAGDAVLLQTVVKRKSSENYIYDGAAI